MYDPVPANRTATRTVLFTLGFRNIETVATVEDFRKAIHARPPDLALPPGLGLMVVEWDPSGWARVVASNQWSAWVDGRQLVPYNPPAGPPR